MIWHIPTCISDGRWTFAWDGENRATSFTRSSGAPAGAKLKVDCQYDYGMRRVEKVVSGWNGSAYVAQFTNRVVYDGWNVVAVLDDTNGLKRGQSRQLTIKLGSVTVGRMARKLRVEYPGAIYHVMNRGDRREPIFQDDTDRERFLTTLGEVCGKTGWQVQAWCLMGNHFHLVVETPQGNLVAGMKWFLGTYTSRFNRRHKLFGHLFSGRYKALIVDGSGNGYLKTVCDYVHLNPARAKLLQPEEPLRAYRWSSWPEYLKAPGKRWRWLRGDRLLGEYRIPHDSAAGRRELEQAVEARRAAESGVEYKDIRRGWCLGAPAFKQELLEQMEGGFGGHHGGAERAESAEAGAERWVRAELQRLGWDARELERRRKGDPVKVRLARRLRRETTMTLAWIAARLAMGSASMVTHCLRKQSQ